LLAVTPFTGIDTILLGGPEYGRGSAAETVLGRGGGIPNEEFLRRGAASDSVLILDTWSLIGGGFLAGGSGTIREGDDPGCVAAVESGRGGGGGGSRPGVVGGGGTDRMDVPVFLGWIGGTGLEGRDGGSAGESPSECGVAIREGGVAVLGGGGGLPGGRGGFVLGLGGGTARLGGPGLEKLSTGLEGGSGVERWGGACTLLLGSWGGVRDGNVGGGGCWDGGGGGRLGG